MTKRAGGPDRPDVFDEETKKKELTRANARMAAWCTLEYAHRMV